MAGYHTDQERSRQLQAARDLLKPSVHVVIVHTLSDEFSNPNMNPEYWNTLISASIGEGIDDRNKNLTVVTFDNFNHEILRKFAEGMPDDPRLGETMKQSFLYLGHFLNQPILS